MIIPTGTSTPLPLGPEVGWHIDLDLGNAPPVDIGSEAQQEEYRADIFRSKQPIQDIFKAVHIANSKEELRNLYDVIVPNNYGSGYRGSYSKILSIDGYNYKLRIHGYSSYESRNYYDIYKMGFGYLDRFSKFTKTPNYDSGYAEGFYMTGYERNYLITIGSNSVEGFHNLKIIFNKYKR